MLKLSKTQLTQYSRCPQQYAFRYIEGLKMPPSSAMLMGSSLDKALNINYENKIKTGNDEPESILTDAFVDNFDKEKNNTVFDKDENPDKMKDGGVKVTKKFREEICPSVSPLLVQKKDEIIFENVDYSLMVVVDLIETDGMIVDNKFSGKTWAEGRELQELDPVIYSIWYNWSFKKMEKGFRFDIGINTKEPKTQQIKRKVNADEKLGFLKYLAFAKDSIEYDTKRGYFLPRTDHFLCSKRSCGYHEICSKRWNIRIKD